MLCYRHRGNGVILLFYADGMWEDGREEGGKTEYRKDQLLEDND